MKMKLECLALFAVFCLPLCAQHVYDMARFGIQPGKKSNMSTRMEKALAKIRKEVKEGKAVTLRFQSGTYHAGASGSWRTKQDLCADAGKGGRCPCLIPQSWKS